MSAQDAGTSGPDSPLEFFERTIRPAEESDAPRPDLRIDRLLGFHEEEGERLLDGLEKIYPAGHWARERASYRFAIEAAMQLLSAGLCRLATAEGEGGGGRHPLECCARLVNAPTLSPYIRRRLHNYVIVPAGFLSSLERFVTTTFALAAVAAAQDDPERKTAVWDPDIFLGSIAVLADRDVGAFTRGVLEAASESALQQTLEDFGDPLAFLAFDRDAHGQLNKMMAAGRWQKLGFTSLGAALERYPEVRGDAIRIARLALCFAVCHEFGHVFTLSVEEEGAKALAADEAFTDMVGTLILYRLTETGILPAILNSEVSPLHFGQALAAFHAWNLCKELAGVLARRPQEGSPGAFAPLQEVALRWEAAMRLIGQVWREPVPALPHNEEATRGMLIVNHWGVVAGGLLRAVLLKNGHNMDIEQACEVLPLLAKRNSRLYTYLGGPATPA